MSAISLQLKQLEQHLGRLDVKTNQVYEQVQNLSIQVARIQASVESQYVSQPPSAPISQSIPPVSGKAPCILTIQNDASLLQCINIDVKAKHRNSMHLQAMIDAGATLSISC